MGIITILTLAGCAPSGAVGEPRRDDSARAQFDSASGEIVMPLSDYEFFDLWSDQATLNHAKDISVGKCMNGIGISYSAASVAETPEANPGDRQYGLWDVSRAEIYGFGVGASAVQSALDSDGKAAGDAWRQGYDQCSQKSDPEVDAFTPSNDETTNSLVPRIQTEAYVAAAADPAWQQAREKWWSCLRTAGLEPQTGANQWDSKQAEALIAQIDPSGHSPVKEEEIRVAFTEATCNQQTQMAQTLGNLEAAYQQPLIDQNQAALNEVKVQKQSRLSGARSYIAENG